MSGRPVPVPLVSPPGVAGPTGPAFVERSSSAPLRATAGVGVAGPTGPAFVERHIQQLHIRRRHGVAGPTGPAFVERLPVGEVLLRRRELPVRQDRPSLSGHEPDHGRRVGEELPVRQDRPSLSGPRRVPRQLDDARVAGPTGPAFVERSPTAGSPWRSTLELPVRQDRPSLSAVPVAVGLQDSLRVAGPTGPAFVERRNRSSGSPGA